MADLSKSQNPPKRKPTQAELLARLDYDPISGALTRKDHGVGRSFRRAGRRCGHLRKDGYVHVKIKSTSYYAHCVIWCMVTGELAGPTG